MGSDDATAPATGIRPAAPTVRAPARYTLGARLGEGGMGVVYEAHDRVLDRTVALKFLHDELLGAELQARLTAEARAMARLNHPNVVTVFDVGELDGRTYLAMELVRGRSMRAWLAERHGWPKTAAMFRDLARGLAAAHAAGIVHRDIKPGNLLVGDDGRGRIADFGIAVPEPHAVAGADAAPARVIAVDPRDGVDPASTAVTALTGTPRYMAPERRAGAPADALADQYAFCVVLYEALHGRHPFPDDATAASPAPPAVADIPAWLHAAVTRGLAHMPSARFPSMDALAAALAPPRRTARWLAAGAVGVAAIAATAVVIGRASAVDRCAGAPAELAASWNPQVRDRIAAHLKQLGPYGADQAAAVTTTLDDAGTSWVAAHRRACEARTRGEATDALYERRMVCLARARASLATAIDLAGSVTAAGVGDAVRAVRAVDTTDDCSAPDTSDARPPPAIADPAAELADQIADARVRAIAEQPDAVDRAIAAVAAADKLGFPPLAVRARFVLGTALLTATPSAAVEPLQLATRGALELGDDAIAVEAYARGVYARAMAGKDAYDGLDVMEPIASRLRGRAAFARILLHNNLGIAALAASDRIAARQWFTKAYDAVAAGFPADQVELTNVPANLALAEDDPARQRQLLEEARAVTGRSLGADHPQVIFLEYATAVLRSDRNDVTTGLTAACDRFIALHPHLTRPISECAYELGYLAVERGDVVAAGVAFARVTEDATLRELAALQGRLAHEPSETTAALVAFGDRLHAHEAWWERERAAYAYLAAAPGLEAIGDRAGARAALERSTTLFEGILAVVPRTVDERRLARARAELARLLPPTDPRAVTLAVAALTWYRTAGGYDDVVAALAPIAQPAQGPGTGTRVTK